MKDTHSRSLKVLVHAEVIMIPLFKTLMPGRDCARARPDKESREPFHGKVLSGVAITNP
jgi:hypothetical protein